MDLALQCQISSHPTAIISALIIAEEVPSSSAFTAGAMLQISCSSDDSYTDDEVPPRFVTPYVLPASVPHYWEFLDHPGRCGVLYHERAKCYTRIMHSWLLFLEAPPDLEEPDSPVHEECRKIVLANWSRILSKCAPGDKDLICQLRDFTLDKACKEDVERVIAWLEVSVFKVIGHSLISWIYLCVLQMEPNIPKDILVRWKTYGSEQCPLSYEVAPVQTVTMGTCIFCGIMIATVMSLIPKPMWDRLLNPV